MIIQRIPAALIFDNVRTFIQAFRYHLLKNGRGIDKSQDAVGEYQTIDHKLNRLDIGAYRNISDALAGQSQ